MVLLRLEPRRSNGGQATCSVRADIRPVSATHEVAVLAPQILDKLKAALDGCGTTRHEGLAIALSQMRYTMSGEEDALRLVRLRPIGMIHSPHRRAEETPIQAVHARGVRGRAEVLPEYADGLRDLEGFSHMFLIYWFHKACSPQLIVKPFLDDATRGVFATRAPCRPNPIGLSTVRLVEREGNVLHLEDLDVLDGTPLLDIKPYVARFDRHDNTRSGWIEDIDEETARRLGSRRT